MGSRDHITWSQNRPATLSHENRLFFTVAKKRKSKAALGSLDVKKASKKFKDVVTGQWSDTSYVDGSWSVNGKPEVIGYFNKESQSSNFANLYVEKDGIAGLSPGDLYVGYAQGAVSTVGYGEWNWSSGAKMGDYFSGTGTQKVDAGRFFLSDTSFLG